MDRKVEYPAIGVHIHGVGCGHTAVQHGNHIGYLVDGHLHCLVSRSEFTREEGGEVKLRDDEDLLGEPSARTVFVIHTLEESCSDQISCVASAKSTQLSATSSGRNSNSLHRLSSRNKSPHEKATPDGTSATSNRNRRAKVFVARTRSNPNLSQLEKFGEGSKRPELLCKGHTHGPSCGHEQVKHGGHFDYLVGKTLHHPHGDHCDRHHVALRRARSLSPTLHTYARVPEDDSTTDDEITGLTRRRNMTSGEVARATPVEVPFYKDRDAMRFIAMFFITGGYFFVELIWGILADSLALRADAMHMLSDGIALCVGYYCLKQSRRTRTDTATFGWIRMEVVGGLMNGVFLLATTFNIVMEAIHRLIEPNPESTLEENAVELLYVAGAGLGANIIGLFVFGHGHGHGHSHVGPTHDSTASQGENPQIEEIEMATLSTDVNNRTTRRWRMPKITNFNLRAVLLHVAGDALGSVAVMISAAIIAFSNLPGKLYADPICSMVIAVIICFSTFPLVKSTVRVLLQMVPSSIDLPTLQEELLRIDGVEEIHDLHVYLLNLSKGVGTFHVIIRRGINFRKVSDALKAILHRHDIHSTTIQPEFAPRGANVAMGPNGENCSDQICPAPACTTNACCAPRDNGSVPSTPLAQKKESKENTEDDNDEDVVVAIRISPDGCEEQKCVD